MPGPHPAVFCALAALTVIGIIIAQYGWWAGVLAAMLSVMSWMTGVLHERYSSAFSMLARRR